MVRYLLITLFVATFKPYFSLASIYEIPVPQKFQECFDEFGKKTDLRKTPGDLIKWQCVQRYARRINNFEAGKLAQADEDWFEELVKSMDPSQGCDPGKADLRVRKEIRQLSKTERERLFNAIRVLKETPYGNTTRYDYLASMHSGNLISVAHFGPNFLPWHRFYILAMENALRQIEPTVTVPYWDPGLDSSMLRSELKPTESVIWTSEFFGNGDGEVVTGQFQNWTTSTGMLIRNIGRSQDPALNNLVWEKLLTKAHLEEISPSTADIGYDLLAIHGAPHTWIGGHMAGINTAAWEPIFFFYHCFIDFIFEQWQQSAKAAGTDVENEWPLDATGEHAKGSTFGFGKLTNTQGMSSYFRSCVFRYEEQPKCSQDNQSCGSEFLSCDSDDEQTYCRSKSMEEVGEAKQRFSNDNEGVQNSFCINKNCTTDNWVFLPVEVVQFRSPGYQSRRSHRVESNNNIDRSRDIYTPEKYGNLMPKTTAGELATYGRCLSEGMHDIMIETTGLNYDGIFYEIDEPDNRLPLSKSIAYIAVRKPDEMYTRVFLSASDSCGRVCKIYCRDKIRQKEYYQCSGAFEITPQDPLGYADTIEDVLHEMWKIDEGTCPSSTSEEVYIQIFCDYSADWIWNNSNANTSG